MSAKWFRLFAIILIPSLLIAAWILAKPHQPKSDPNQALQQQDRLQWSSKATAYTRLPTASPAPYTATGPGALLQIPSDKLDAAGLQVSLRMKPRGTADAPSVNPIGSGTLTINGNKYSFLVDSTSVLSRYRLTDGTIYVRGPLTVTIGTSQGELQASLGVSSILGSGEGLWTYTNPDGQGIVTFGAGFNKGHAAEIAAIT